MFLKFPRNYFVIVNFMKLGSKRSLFDYEFLPWSKGRCKIATLKKMMCVISIETISKYGLTSLGIAKDGSMSLGFI